MSKSYYIVKNASVADRAAANNTENPITSFVTTPRYDLLVFNAGHTFDGTEDYYYALSASEAEAAKKLPVFIDYVQFETDYGVAEALKAKKGFGDQDEFFCKRLHSEIMRHFKGDGLGTSTEGGAMAVYMSPIDLYGNGSVLASPKDFLDLFSVDGFLLAAQGILAAVQSGIITDGKLSEDFLNIIIAECQQHLEKWPR